MANIESILSMIEGLSDEQKANLRSGLKDKGLLKGRTRDGRAGYELAIAKAHKVVNKALIALSVAKDKSAGMEERISLIDAELGRFSDFDNAVQIAKDETPKQTRTKRTE